MPKKTGAIKKMTTDEMVELLKEMVMIKSESSIINKNNRVQKIVARELRKTGMKVNFIQSKNHADLVVGEKHGLNKRWITIIAHGDVVNANDDFVGFEINKSGTIASGPGVIDCKGGIVIAIAALREFFSVNKESAYPIRFICSPSEEIGSPGYVEKLRRYGKESEYLLSFEPGLPNGDFVHSRAGNRWYEINIEGRAAHSGRYFMKGVNAIEAMAIKLYKLRELTDLTRNVTLAVTAIESSNHNNNTIPGFCRAYIDTRFIDNDESERLHNDILAILKTVDVTAYSDFKPAILSYRITDYSAAAMQTKKSEPYVKQYEKILKKYDHKHVTGIVGRGSADCNLMLDNKETVFIGSMGAYGGGPHTIDEHIKLKTLTVRSKAAYDLLDYINKEKPDME